MNNLIFEIIEKIKGTDDPFTGTNLGRQSDENFH